MSLLEFILIAISVGVVSLKCRERMTLRMLKCVGDIVSHRHRNKISQRSTTSLAYLHLGLHHELKSWTIFID